LKYRGLQIKDFSYYYNNSHRSLVILIILFIISHLPFVLKGIGEPDSARIATIVVDRIIHGTDSSLTNYYFTDTIPLYIHYLIWVLKLFNNNFSYLPAIMNYSNFVFAALTVIPSFLLINNIFRNSAIAFYSVLVLMFAPSFFQSSIYGAPHLIAFFFFVTSLYCYATWLDNFQEKGNYSNLIFSSIALTITMLIKSPIVLAGGIYIGLLFLKKVKDIKVIILSVICLLFSLLCFIGLRQLLIGPTGGSTSSPVELLAWIKHFFTIPSPSFIARQIKPPIFGAGILTSLLGIISFGYYIFKRKTDMLIFVLSWVAATNFFWFFVLGNNARHFMVSLLPLIVMIIMYIYERSHRFTGLFTVLLILGNYFILPPTSSTYYPSGNVFESAILLEKRNEQYHNIAKEIVRINHDKVAVMGSFNTPYVVYELVSSLPYYEGELLTSTEKAIISIRSVNKEYIIFYLASDNPRVNIERALTEYDLKEYVLVSSVYDLKWLENRGMKIVDRGVLEPQQIPRFRSILRWD
jgi:hypothetical protein